MIKKLIFAIAVFFLAFPIVYASSGCPIWPGIGCNFDGSDAQCANTKTGGVACQDVANYGWGSDGNCHNWMMNHGCNDDLYVCCPYEPPQEPECDNDADCGLEEWIGSPYCKSGDLYSTEKTHACNNPGTSAANCESDTHEAFYQSCNGKGCTNGQCNQQTGCNPACDSNHECINNQCVLKQQGCQYNAPSCDSNHNCINNQCVPKSEAGCQYHNPDCNYGYSCINNKCEVCQGSSLSFTGTVVTPNSVKLTWSGDPGNCFQRFELYKSSTPYNSPSEDVLVATIDDKTTTSYLVDGLEFNKLYYFKLRIFNSQNNYAEIQITAYTTKPQLFMFDLKSMREFYTSCSNPSNQPEWCQKWMVGSTAEQKALVAQENAYYLDYSKEKFIEKNPKVQGLEEGSFVAGTYSDLIDAYVVFKKAGLGIFDLIPFRNGHALKEKTVVADVDYLERATDAMNKINGAISIALAVHHGLSKSDGSMVDFFLYSFSSLSQGLPFFAIPQLGVTIYSDLGLPPDAPIIKLVGAQLFNMDFWMECSLNKNDKTFSKCTANIGNTFEELKEDLINNINGFIDAGVYLSHALPVVEDVKTPTMPIIAGSTVNFDVDVLNINIFYGGSFTVESKIVTDSGKTFAVNPTSYTDDLDRHPANDLQKILYGASNSFVLIDPVKPYTNTYSFSWTVPSDFSSENAELVVTTYFDNPSPENLVWTKSVPLTLKINHPPVLSYIPDKHAVEGERITLTFSATDQDNDALIFYVDNPNFIRQDCCTFNWDTEEGDAGGYSLNVSVTDGSLWDSRRMTLYIYDVIPKCYTDRDCGNDKFESVTECRNGDVYGLYTYNICNDGGTLSASCSANTDFKIKDKCNNGCENGKCKSSYVFSRIKTSYNINANYKLFNYKTKGFKIYNITG